MPSPFKERFIATYKDVLQTGICFGVGGMFDIMAGNVKRAPARVQKLGLEWLYRITQNPVKHTKRVFKALIPCCCVFAKNLFEPRKQTF
jgi:N-acetylglucosaminyldiphosphoundecaprenol N-acetyl-beta-D-mannosaminyltransferase